MIMSLFFFTVESILASLFSSLFLLMNADVVHGSRRLWTYLFFNINLKRENEGFEEADCQTYTYVPPNAVPSPYNSPKPFWLHHFIPRDPGGTRSALQ